MREIGIVTLLSVAATAAAPTPRVAQPAPRLSATAQYAACLASKANPGSTRWWIVANDRGGSIAMPARPNIQHAYLVVIGDQGERREIVLDPTDPDRQQQKGENQCN